MLSVLSRNARNRGLLKVEEAFFSRLQPQVPTGRGSNLKLPKPQDAPKPVKRDMPKVGRNDPCPCGNGKKFKKCCGRAA